MFLHGPWNLKGIPPHIVQHQIKLDAMIPPSCQNWYWMNPSYVVVVKEDLDKILIASFIVLVKEATFLSPIMVVPKKNGKLSICIDFRRSNTTIKKNHTLYSLQRRYWIW
jgi:hypothetical protein